MANEFTWGRPKADDDEEELLRQQEEFLKAKQQPCTKLINSKDSTNVQRVPPNVSKVKSHFSNLKKLDKKQDVVSTSQGSGNVINSAIKDKIQEKKLEDMVQNIPTVSSNIILGNIIEKKFDIEKYKFADNHVSATSKLGFPQVFGSDNVAHIEKVCYIYEIYCQYCFYICYTIFLLCRRPVAKVYSGKNSNLSKMLQWKFRRMNPHPAKWKIRMLRWMIK